MELEVGSVVEGKVSGITKFGAFVSLPGGKSGLVHISEIASSYVSEVSDFLQVGQDVKVKIIGIDDFKRINLSIKKAVEPDVRDDSAGGSRSTRPAKGRGVFAQKSVGAPMDFEDRLKQFMQSSDSKLSELRYIEKKGGNRRGGRK